MQPELLTFRKFNDLALAQNLAAILADNGIEYLLEESPVLFNPTFATRTEMSTEYSVKISSADFTEATKLIAAHESTFTDDVEADYYLFDFTTTELMEIIAKPDEWSSFDYALAKKILAQGGIPIDEAAEKRFSEKRIAELKQPERSETTWVTFGYVFAIIGGVLGFFIGWELWNSKKTLPNGEQVYTYTEGDRKHGKQIFYLSALGLVIGIVYKIMNVK
jgi:hypothetical protein